MLDLFAGLGGASQAMRERGWSVTTLDLDPAFGTDVVADIRGFAWSGPRPDLVWASPPCDEFSRESMPWCKTGTAPDLSLVKATLDVVRATAPRFWVLENTRGAQRWIGRAPKIVGPFYLWGWFPDFDVRLASFRPKESYASTAHAQRAKVPPELSLALALAIERVDSAPEPLQVPLPL